MKLVADIVAALLVWYLIAGCMLAWLARTSGGLRVTIIHLDDSETEHVNDWVAFVLVAMTWPKSISIRRGPP